MLVRFVLLCGTALLFSSLAKAQSSCMDPADFGKPSAVFCSQTTGSSANDFAAQGSTYELITSYAENSALRKAAKSIVRIDILKEDERGQSVEHCTGSLVSNQVVLTNHHCIDLDGKGNKRAIIWVDLITQSAKEAVSYELSLSAFEADQRLDYALVKLARPVSGGWQPLNFNLSKVENNAPLAVIHHPNGFPKRISRAKCRAFTDTHAPGGVLGHTCDTQGGSSGSLLFDEFYAAVGLHHSGGLRADDPSSYNQSTPLALVVQASSYLKELVSHNTAGNSNTPASPQSAPRPEQPPIPIADTTPAISDTGANAIQNLLTASSETPVPTTSADTVNSLLGN